MASRRINDFIQLIVIDTGIWRRITDTEETLAAPCSMLDDFEAERFYIYDVIAHRYSDVCASYV